jgi:hypothetical protein
MERLGLGAAACSAANRSLIYCSMPGFASDDPRAAVPGWEGVVAAAAGLYLPGTWDASLDPAPVFNPVPGKNPDEPFRRVCFGSGCSPGAAAQADQLDWAVAAKY